MFKEQIKRGMEYLDEHVTDWEYRLNLQDLFLGSCERCMCGQLFGSFCAFIMKDGNDKRMRSYDLAKYIGFMIGEEHYYAIRDDVEEFAGINDPYVVLTDEWLVAIKARLNERQDEQRSVSSPERGEYVTAHN